jgi:hypothetical protein
MENTEANLANIEDSKIVEEQSDVKKPLQKLKIKKGEKPETENAVTKTKRERTQKQIDATKKMIETRNAKIIISKEKQEQEAVIKKKEIEEKIVKKAVAIKKREIKQKAILDTISDDDTDIAEIKKIATKIKPLSVPPKPLTFWDKCKFI